MPWYDFLTKIVPKNLVFQLKNVRLIQLRLDIKGPFLVVNDNRKTILQINPNQLDSIRRDRIFSQLPNLVQSGIDVLSDEFATDSDDYKERISSSSNQDIITFFSGKIPDSDMPILKASLYLKSVLESGGETRLIKERIVYRFGVRGRNISNLCSAGYFDSLLRPLYDQMSSTSRYSHKKFLNLYEEMIVYCPFALFIHSHMSPEEVKSELTRKIVAMKEYGIQTLNIHGIGQYNVTIMQRVVDEVINSQGMGISKIVEKVNNFLIIRLAIRK